MFNRTNIRFWIILGVLLSVIVSKSVQDTMLNRLGVVSAIGIDRNDKEFKITLQIFNPAANKKEGQEEIGAYTFSQKGKTISEAIEKLNRVLARKIFLNTVQLVVISDTLARKEGISLILNYLLREPNFPGSAKLVISKDVPPDKMLQVITPVQKIAGSRLYEILNNNKTHWGSSNDVTPLKAEEQLLRDTTELVIPYVMVNGKVSKGFTPENIKRSTPKTLLAIEGLAVFKKAYLSHFMSSANSNLLSYTKHRAADMTLVVPCPNQEGFMTWKNISSTSRIQSSIKHGIPSLSLRVRVKGNLQDTTCRIDALNLQVITQLENEFKTKLQSELTTLIKDSQQKQVDFLGFSEAIYQQNPKDWERMAKKWNTLYSHAEIDAQVEAEIINIGEINKISN